ncbi:MAG: beta-lactamase family protein [Spirochaetaceae bacterium]|nr:MAG: beta-lactamase family protein [Spirochaetaceae bacterium]
MKTAYAVLVALAAIAVLVGCSTLGGAQMVEDPAGRFSFQVSAELAPQPTDGSYFHYTYPAPEVQTYIVAVDAEEENTGISRAFDSVGIDSRELVLAGVASFGEWRLQRYAPGEDGQWSAIASQYRDSTAYAFIVSGGKNSDPDSLPTPVFRMLSSFEFSSAAGEVFRPVSFAELEEFIDTRILSSGGSVSIAALKDGEIVYQYASGKRAPDTPTDTSTAYHWGSITKLVTATAVMQQVELGRIDLDASVVTYVPEFALGSSFTVRNLLSHTTGLPDESVTHLISYSRSGMPSLEEVWSDYWPRVGKLVFEPGSSSAYNNFNFLLLGVLFERVSGEELASYAQQHIFAPIGMDRTAHFSEDLPAGTSEAKPVISKEMLSPALTELARSGYDREKAVAAEIDGLVYLNPYNILPCWGGVKGTADDATRFAWMFLNGGEVDGNRVLDKRSVRWMMSVQKSNDGKPLPYGLGWVVGRQGRDPYVEHAGGGEGIDSLLRFYPKQNLAVAVLGSVNSYGAGTILEFTAQLVSDR